MSIATAPTEQKTTEQSMQMLSAEALEFLADLHREFEPRRQAILLDRLRTQHSYDGGEWPGFSASTAIVRKGEWQVARPPHDLTDRRTEITGPVDRKMMINALNSGAKVFMADFEDATSPTLSNLVLGQANLLDAYRRSLTFEAGDRTYSLKPETATLMVRPRGWHLPERNLAFDDAPAAGALVDFGLYMFHSAWPAIETGSGPYFYLPKLESHLEARLWNDIFCWAQDRLGIARGTVRATVLIETLPAAFEMEEILFELREHSAGLNAGRWDYIFSVIKTMRGQPGMVLPDRRQVTMETPFMAAYSDLLVATCHKRGAQAIGGMAAQIPSRTDPEANARAIEIVAADKRREANAGFDGTWVAHPDLVPVARAEFDMVLGDRPNQLERLRPDVVVMPADLLDTSVDGGRVTEAGLRVNIRVAIRYMATWLCGTGAVAIAGLMEDAATAEISRTQVWQWIRYGVEFDDGRIITKSLVRILIEDEMERLRYEIPPGSDDCLRFLEARRLFEGLVMAPELADFFTLSAYEILEEKGAR